MSRVRRVTAPRILLAVGIIRRLPIRSGARSNEHSHFHAGLFASGVLMMVAFLVSLILP